MKINSILGPVDTAALGQTLMHEHILIANHIMRHTMPDWVNIDEFVPYAVKLIERAKRNGIKTIVDMTTFQLGRDARVMREVAERAEIQLIACTGYHWFDDVVLVDKGAEFLAERLIKDIEQGMEGTDSKAGLIKCATDAPGITPILNKVLKATVIAHKATGVPISTHSVGEKGAWEQVAFFESEGVDLRHVIIGHVGDSTNMQFLKDLAAKGCNLGHDRFGLDAHQPQVLSSAARIDTLIGLWEAGYLEQVTVSHDASCFIDYWEGQEDLGNPWEMIKKNDPETLAFQFSYFSENVLPVLRERGMGDGEINTLLVDTPRRIFEGR